MGNVIASKAYQPKYLGLNSSWFNLNVQIAHLDEIEDETFFDLSAGFKKTRRASIIFTDGIRLLNEKGIKSFGLNKRNVWVSFNDDYVRLINNQVAEISQIQNDGFRNEVRIDWKETPGAGEDFLVEGSYYTTSPSRGTTTQGQGAVDFLTVSALFGEGLRNLLFDKVKNQISILVLKRFISYRRFYLRNKSRIVQKSLSANEYETLRGMIIELSDALYMSGAYFKSDDNFEKRHIDTRYLNSSFNTAWEFDEVLGVEVLNPDYLEGLVKAYA